MSQPKNGANIPKEIDFSDLFATDISSDGRVNVPNATETINPMPDTKVFDTTSTFDSFNNYLNKEFGAGKNSKKDGDSSGNLGSTLAGVGAITGALASVYGIYEQRKYQDEVLGMEKERVAKNEARRDKKQSEYDKVWG